VRSAFARFRRYWQISRIAARHGLGPYLRGRRRGEDAARGQAALALSLRRALEEGGVTFTKLGQLLSTRRDLLPEEFISELARLQDRAEPAPWEQVEEVITQSLGAPGQVFAELQHEPAAAASIAQVHKARLRRDGGVDAEVAVKVQRPGIRATVEQDLDILQRLAVRLERRARWRVRSARPAWPVDSPLPCGKNSISGWRPATRLPWPLRGRVSSGPSGAALR
jgi:ubiquinone biosynthesis protein